MFVVASDHLIDGPSYKDDVTRRRKWQDTVIWSPSGMPIRKPETRFGYIRCRGEDVLAFIEKPDAQTAESYCRAGDYLINSGMFLFRVGSLMQELRRFFPWLYNSCEAAFYMRRVEGKHTYYAKEILENILPVPIEKSVFERTDRGRVIHSTFQWQDIGSLEDLALTGIERDERNQILYGCRDTTVLNQSDHQIVVANDLENITIINTEDAVYVGKTGESDRLKAIMKENPQEQHYFDQGRVIYKPWGHVRAPSCESAVCGPQGGHNGRKDHLCAPACPPDGALDHRLRPGQDHAGRKGKARRELFRGGIRTQRQH